MKIKVQRINDTDYFPGADGWSVREDRVLQVWRHLPPPEGVPGARRAQVLAQYNNEDWQGVFYCDYRDDTDAG